MLVLVNIVVLEPLSCLVSSVRQVFVVMVRFLTGVSAGKFVSETAGISTNTPVGINTATVDDNDLTGIGNSFKGFICCKRNGHT